MNNTPLFVQELAALINAHGLDKECSTPDYILATYLAKCLLTYRETIIEAYIAQNKGIITG